MLGLMLLVPECKGRSIVGLCSRVIYWKAMSSFWIWGEMDCLALPLPISLCCLLSALWGTLPFPLYLPFPNLYVS